MGKVAKAPKASAVGEKKIKSKKADGASVVKEVKRKGSTLKSPPRVGLMKSLESITAVGEKKIKSKKADVASIAKEVKTKRSTSKGPPRVGLMESLESIPVVGEKIKSKKADGASIAKEVKKKGSTSKGPPRVGVVNSLESIPAVGEKKIKSKKAEAASIAKEVKKRGQPRVGLIQSLESIPVVGEKKMKTTKADGASVVKEAKEKETKSKGQPRVGLMKSLKSISDAESSVTPFLAKRKSGKSSSLVQKRKKSEKPSEETVPNTEQEKQTIAVPKLDREQIAQGVSAVLALAKQEAEAKNELFDGDQQPILLQITCMKVAKVPTRQLRLLLPHTLVTDSDDVALFVKDMQKGRGKDYEPTVNHYQDLLREHGCTQIKDVIPLNQVKTEFDQFELKRKLLSSYDYFLTDGAIAGHLSHLLGKIFINKRKLPTSIRMQNTNLKREIDYALRKTSMQLHSHGNTHIVQIGHTSMDEEKIVENILSVWSDLRKNYPGGWLNIRSLILKTPKSLPIPVYITLKSKNQVKVAVVAPKRPKAHLPRKGELSTLSGNAHVVVMPDGRVTMHRKMAIEDDEDFDQPKAKKRKVREDVSL